MNLHVIKYYPLLLILHSFFSLKGVERTESSFGGFSGQVLAKVEGKMKEGTRIKVLRVNRIWRNNRVKNPEQLAEKSIVIRAEGNSQLQDLQNAYLSGLRIGQIFPIDIKKGENEYWEILELNPEQKKIAINQLESKHRQTSDSETGKKDISNTEIFMQSPESNLETKEIFVQLSRFKRENAELRSRLSKLESRLLKIENQLKNKK